MYIYDDRNQNSGCLWDAEIDWKGVRRELSGAMEMLPILTGVIS